MKVVTVHRGARDNYQVALGLHEAGMLEALVTDLYWPADRAWARLLERVAPGQMTDALRNRQEVSLPSTKVKSCPRAGLYAMTLFKSPYVTFERQRDAIRKCDDELGKRAGLLATQREAGLLSYSYYGYSAFSHYAGDQPRILFQLHPHPSRVREILLRERQLHPEYSGSLDKEWELSLPSNDFDRLVQEAAMPDYWIVASTFSKQTLVEAGMPADRIRVIPYGTNLERFQPGNNKKMGTRALCNSCS